MTKDKSKVPVKPRCVVAQFCDDIRYEVGNKVTLVGLYNASLFLQEFPALIPRLGINLIVETPIEDIISSVVLKIERGEEIIFQSTVTIPPRVSFDEVLQNGHDEITRRTFGMQISLPPITVMSPCMLRVVVVLDGVESIAGKLRISATPVGSNR